ncbi:MAG: hypothetical protein HPAVJP_5310 [Candidatus Hepatoplasma vulgare]|nr:MAG: hypothetical protein HPAVJP_5310 [Candidatus Hepatoplasma sp.]
MNEEFNNNNNTNDENIKIEENNTKNWTNYRRQFKNLGFKNNFSKMKNTMKDYYQKTNPFLRPFIILLAIPIAIIISAIFWLITIVAGALFFLISLFFVLFSVTGFTFLIIGWFLAVILGGIVIFIYSLYQLIIGQSIKKNKKDLNDKKDNNN